MKKAKKSRLLPPMTYRTLEIDFVKRTINLAGQIVVCEADILSIPLLTSERPIWPVEHVRFMLGRDPDEAVSG